VTPDYQKAFVLPEGATEVILVRHGAAEGRDPVMPHGLVGGHSDPPLIGRGHEQALALAVRLGELPIAGLFITNLKRTAQTAAPLAKRLGLDPVVVPELREVNLGVWESDGGFSQTLPERQALRRQVLEEQDWGLIPEAESLATLGARVRQGLETVAQTTGPDAIGVAVAHGAVIAEICHQVTESRPFAFIATENGSITRLIRHADGSWILQSFNDTAHLRPERRTNVELNWSQLDLLTNEVRGDGGPGSEGWNADDSHTRKFNEAFIESFRANNHKIPGELGQVDLLLMTCTGAKSGAKRTVPLGFHRIDGRLIVVASMGGAHRNPPWFHNVRANPDVTIEMEGETFEATAVIPSGADRDKLFAGVVANFDVFDDYQKRTKRTLPVVEIIRKEP
jgi:probable phosphoglycerate mutase